MNVFVNGHLRQVDPATPLLSVLDVPADGPPPRGVAVALDGTVVPRARYGDTALHEGARVEVVTAVQGG